MDKLLVGMLGRRGAACGRIARRKSVFRRICGAYSSGEARQSVRIWPGTSRHEQYKAEHGVQTILGSMYVAESILEV